MILPSSLTATSMVSNQLGFGSLGSMVPRSRSAAQTRTEVMPTLASISWSSTAFSALVPEAWLRIFRSFVSGSIRTPPPGSVRMRSRT